MINLGKNRAAISMATAFMGLVVMATSVCLLFHARFQGVVGMHKWAGVAFIVLCCLHVAINLKPLCHHCRGGSAALVIALVSLLTCGVIVVGIAGDNGERGHHGTGYGSRIAGR